jgi:hypothetical protein
MPASTVIRKQARDERGEKESRSGRSGPWGAASGDDRRFFRVMPRLSWASTSFRAFKQDVDGRDKPGHDRGMMRNERNVR